MKTEYDVGDMIYGHRWYMMHKAHVDHLMTCTDECYPMLGSDISNPALWEPAAWVWFFKRSSSVGEKNDIQT